MIISAGSKSTILDQFSFSIPLSIKIATYSKAPAVAQAGTIRAIGDKKIDSKKNNPIKTVVRPVRPPASTPAELST